MPVATKSSRGSIAQEERFFPYFLHQKVPAQQCQDMFSSSGAACAAFQRAQIATGVLLGANEFQVGEKDIKSIHAEKVWMYHDMIVKRLVFKMVGHRTPSLQYQAELFSGNG